ncbi:MAG: glycosyltransferase family 39 protein, partial [Synergistaceae bacterium]|nr:glycosyltransferase family 39 protein [Synergistaceae bacterium]
MAFTCADNPCVIGNTYTDSSVFHYVARVMLKGGMPYRDAFDHKGTLIFLIDVFGLWLNKDIGVWIMELVFIFIALLFAYKIARLVSCSKIESMLVIVLTVFSLSCYFEGGNLTEEYACTFIMVSLYIFLKFFKTGSVNFFELIVCGVSFGAVCLLKINMTVLWVVMFFGVLIECVKRHEIIKFIRYVFMAFVGAAIILVPVVVWLMKNDSFTAFINNYFKFSFMYISDPKRASTINIIKAIGHWGLQSIMIISIPTIIYFCFK